MNTLLVSEIFGPTLQGEGASAGVPAVFLRLAGCNLSCVWCDTRYAWDWAQYSASAETQRLDDEEAERAVRQLCGAHVRLVVITGGEPMLQAVKWWRLANRLSNDGWRVEVETAGTVPVPKHGASGVTRWNVSPKLSNSGNATAARWRADVLQGYADDVRSVFKFVAQSADDVAEIEAMLAMHRIDAGRVFIMPEGRTSAELEAHMLALAPLVIARGWRLSPRLHVHIWGNRRGV